MCVSGLSTPVPEYEHAHVLPTLCPPESEPVSDPFRVGTVSVLNHQGPQEN